MTETASLYGPVAQDISLVGERLRGLARNESALLGEALAYIFESGGKRVRPGLVLLSGKLGRYDLDRLVTLAAAFEAVHTATLVHDDTVDEALTRRGLSTVSAVWNPQIAVLIGDFLFAQSAELAAELDSVRIIHLLSATVMAMSRGELRQYIAARSLTVDEDDYLRRVVGKTASLFAACCEGAAVISGQSEAEIEALRTYGLNLGIAFQIVDDVLDFLGSEESLGKPAGHDLQQGTITLPAILFAESLGKDSPLLRDLKEGRNVAGLLKAVTDSDALDASMERARGFAVAACRALEVFPIGDARDTLVHLADQMVQRQY